MRIGVCDRGAGGRTWLRSGLCLALALPELDDLGDADEYGDNSSKYADGSYEDSAEVKPELGGLCGWGIAVAWASIFRAFSMSI